MQLVRPMPLAPPAHPLSQPIPASTLSPAVYTGEGNSPTTYPNLPIINIKKHLAKSKQQKSQGQNKYMKWLILAIVILAVIIFFKK